MDNIPITGRILCLVDSFDAITSVRNYKAAVPLKEAIEILRSEAGKQFDPNLVEIFADLLENGSIQLQFAESDNMPSEAALSGV